MFVRIALHLRLGSFAWLLPAPFCGETRLNAACVANRGLAARVFYVDSETGHDAHSGHAPDQGWRTLDQVNAAALKPGDTVRFKSGGVWRGSLAPASG